MIKPIKTIDFSWAFVIREIAPGKCRLFIRARANYTPAGAAPFVEWVIGPGDFVNASAMLRGIKKRVETTKTRPASFETAGPVRAMPSGWQL